MSWRHYGRAYCRVTVQNADDNRCSCTLAYTDELVIPVLWYRHGRNKMIWWRHQMETFSALLAICAGNSQVTGELPAQRPVTRSLDVLFHLHLNKRLSKQSWGCWYETPSRSLWRHCYDTIVFRIHIGDLNKSRHTVDLFESVNTFYYTSNFARINSYGLHNHI